MASIQHRTVATNGINMHIAEAGSGPLVLLCHGFPESWYSWRHQLPALADAGFHVVAPDQRGYGQTDAPEENDAYTQFNLVGDIVGLVAALGERQAVVVGHDWGAPVAWNAALWRPDIFRAVAALSVPFQDRGPIAPTAAMRTMVGDGNFFYILYFQRPGVAEHELQHDVRRTLRRLLFGASGNAPDRGLASVTNPPPKTSYFLDQLADTDVLPAWLTGPEVCQLEHGGCAVLFRTPRASLLGVPNALLGVMLYLMLAIGLFLNWPPSWLFLMTLPAVAMSAFLGWSLISRGLQCRICWTGHIANAVLALALGVRAVSGAI